VFYFTGIPQFPSGGVFSSCLFDRRVPPVRCDITNTVPLLQCHLIPTCSWAATCSAGEFYYHVVLPVVLTWFPFFYLDTTHVCSIPSCCKTLYLQRIYHPVVPDAAFPGLNLRRLPTNHHHLPQFLHYVRCVPGSLVHFVLNTGTVLPTTLTIPLFCARSDVDWCSTGDHSPFTGRYRWYGVVGNSTTYRYNV